MKHQPHFTFASGLPDAPLAMPKQMLEQRRPSIFDAFRGVFLAFSGR